MNESAVALLMSVGRLIRSRMEQSLPMPYAQCELLRIVAEKRGVSMREVAAHFKITAPSATSLVEQLVDERYLERGANPQDRREVTLSLTQKGKRMHEEVSGKRTRVLSKILSVLGKRDIEDLQRILSTIIQHT